MGTLPVLRGKGIGSILLRLCLRDLGRQGFRTAIIPWVGPTRFYARFCGARLDRCFWAYQKTI
jgi:mycothiol synthase